MRLSKEQISLARKIDLLSYMKKHNPNNLERVSKKEWALKNHSSLKISNGLWFWFSKEIGGRSALDYLIDVEGVSFRDAVKHLNDLYGDYGSLENKSSGKIINQNKFVPEIVETKFVLPEKADHVRNTYAYLRARGISANCLNKCLKNKTLYQDIRNNAVFVGYKENGEPAYAFKRGTNTYKHFMGEQAGSNKQYSFNIKSENSTQLKIFESAIDAMSYYTLHSHNNTIASHPHLLSLGGIGFNMEKIPAAVGYYLHLHDIDEIGICFDNDDTGRTATKHLMELLEERGYKVTDEPPKVGKDYNDFLLLELEKRQEQYER